MPVQPAQAAAAYLALHGQMIVLIQVDGGVEDRGPVFTDAEYAIGHQHVEVHMAVEVAAEAVHEGHGAVIALRDRVAIPPGAGRGIRTVLTDSRFHGPEKHTEQAADHFVATTPDTSFADMGLASGTWYYVVTAEDFTNNESEPSNQVTLQTAISGVNDETPQAFRVTGAVPNPFNPSTSIHFSLEQGGPTAVEIFDTRGRLVRRLVNESMEAGSHEEFWDGHDDQGRGLPSGVYLAQIRSGTHRGVTKMILAK